MSESELSATQQSAVDLMDELELELAVASYGDLDVMGMSFNPKFVVSKVILVGSC